MNKLLIPASIAALTSACTELSDVDSPPTVEGVELTCAEDLLDLVVVASDANAVTNVVVTGAREDWFPLRDPTTTATTSTWSLDDQSHDCEAPLELDVEVTNLMGLVATAEAAWPETDPEGGGLEPPHGPDSGGTEVTITGTELAYVHTVWFGDEAVSPESAEDEVLVVTTPVGTAGTVDVRLEAPGASTELEAAFTYYPDATGLYGGISRPSLFLYDTTWFTIGSGYADITAGPFLQLDLLLHAPVERSQTYLGNMPALGECAWGSDYGYETEDLGSYLVLDTADDTWAILPSSDSVYFLVEELIEPSDWAELVFDATLPHEGYALPTQSLPEALEVPPLLDTASFDWQDSNPAVWGEDLELWWTSDKPLDGLLYTAYASTGSSPLGVVSCATDAGEGELSLSWETLTADVDPDQVDGLHLSLEFWVDLETPLEHDGSVLWSRGRVIYWVYFPLSAPG